MKTALAVVLLAAACAKPASVPAGNDQIDEDGALGLLMKNDINPAFSKLTFLVFHGNEMQEDPQGLQRELTTAASVLRGAIAKLRAWPTPPTKTTEAREVFFTFATAVDESAVRLSEAVGRFDSTTAAAQMEVIAKTCNSCHHFFRLDIEDSVLPPH